MIKRLLRIICLAGFLFFIKTAAFAENPLVAIITNRAALNPIHDFGLTSNAVKKLTGDEISNIAPSATITQPFGGGSGPYGTTNYTDGVIAAAPGEPYGWVQSNGTIEFSWGDSKKKITKITFYYADRPMASCKIQYWNGSSFVDVKKISATSTNSESTDLSPGIITTKLRFSNIAPSSVSPNFREIQIYGSDNVNSAPSDITLSASNVDETVTALSTVASISTTDPDAGNTFTYSLVEGAGDTDNDFFSISGNALKIKATPDYETNPSYSIRIRSTDQGELYYEKTFTITVSGLATLKNFANLTKQYGDEPFTLSAPESNNTAGTFSYTSSNTDVATIHGDKVTILKPGTTIITATQAAAGYYIESSITDTLTVAPKDITLTLNSVPAIIKVYNGFTRASLAPDNYQLNGVKGDDEVTVYGTASYNTKDAGTSKTITVNDFVLTGEQKDYYKLTTTSATTTGTITARPVTVTADTGQHKIYGEADPELTYTTNQMVYGFRPVEEGLIEGDTLSGKLAREAGKDVGSYGITQGTLTGGINYTINFVPAAFSITTRPVLVTADAGQSKVYGTDDPVFTYTVSSGAPAFRPAVGGLVDGDKLTGQLNREAGEQTGKTYAIHQGTLSAGLNYNLSYVGADFAITKALLTITADNKTKFVGTANPELTASYSGFALDDNENVLTAKPELSTTATTESPLGDYPITVSGAAADNYDISYVNGVLTVKPGAPTSVSLAAATVYENQPAGTPAGTLSSTSDDPNATFTYSLVSGSGDTDNSLFSVRGTEISTASGLNYENKNSYSIRVRSTTQYGFWLEETLTIHIQDVNEAPTLDAIADQTICYTTSQQTVSLSGITAGEEGSRQTSAVTVTTDNPDLFSKLEINGNEVRYKVQSGASGTANITVTVSDNGGSANGGTDTFSRNFIVTVNPLPVISIASDMGTEISKGLEAHLTASGGVNYQWANASGIISGQNSAVLTVRPAETTTYRVTVSNANGCSSIQEFTLTVKEDYQALNINNIMSPDGDGVNDKLVIKNLDMYPNNTMQIFDRAGRLLYSKKNYSNEWDGTFNGIPLAEGTYFYVVDFGPKVGKIKGFVTIVRNR